MGIFGSSMSRELGKNTGKWVSNKIFGDSWSTPSRISIQRERVERKEVRDDARAYKQQLIQMQRDAKEYDRSIKQYQKEQQQIAQEHLLINNARAVKEHNNYLEVIQSVHKDYSNPINWDEILNQPKPEEVKTSAELDSHYREYTNEQVNQKIDEAKRKVKMSFAKNIIGKYYTAKLAWLFKIPSFKIAPLLLYSIILIIMVKSFILGVFVGLILISSFLLLKYGAKDLEKQLNLETELSTLENNREIWFQEYMKEQDVAHTNYLQNLKDYDEMMSIASGVKKYDNQSFIYAINFFKPFQDLKEYGSDISCSNIGSKLSVDFYVHSESVIPNTTKQILRKGLEVKEDFIAPSRFNEIYQDYVCSCILRIGKEIFALLPINEVLINGKGNLLNKATGNYEEQTIVSVLIEKSKIDNLNFDLLDPSDSMTNFQHNMNFKKTEGFYPVTELLA